MVSMKISAISDVHIKIPGDEADILLNSFLDNPLVKSSDYIVLLGDIFDLMCGPHQEYIRRYQHLFEKLSNLQKSGCRVLFFEGNHDVHLEKLFLKHWPRREVFPSQDPQIEKIDGKTYYFSHGDEHEVDNIAYQNYKKTILSAPLKFVANHIMPLSLLNFVGERASKVSRKKGSQTFDSELVKTRFRKGVETVTQGQYDFVLGGHSHVQDNYSFGSSTYVNNGYALRTRTFIFINDHKVSFKSLV